MMKKMISFLLLAIMLCSAALAEKTDRPVIDTSNVPVIPEGTLQAEVLPFTGNQTYAVYSAPDSKSIRGAKNRAPSVFSALWAVDNTAKLYYDTDSINDCEERIWTAKCSNI